MAAGCSEESAVVPCAAVAYAVDAVVAAVPSPKLERAAELDELCSRVSMSVDTVMSAMILLG